MGGRVGGGPSGVGAGGASKSQARMAKTRAMDTDRIRFIAYSSSLNNLLYYPYSKTSPIVA
jgi:hypothetical protein